ncbi:MAG: transglycosylase SLT domain-containing protein [Thermoleophilia bacterium]
MRGRRQRGQALVPVLAVGALLLLGVAAVGLAGGAQATAARAQRGADLAAVSAGRALLESYARPDTPRRRLLVMLRDAAAPAVAAAGGRVVAVRTVGAAAGPPVAVDVEVAVPGPLGTTASATARAGLAPVMATLDGGPHLVAAGGGYHGPLVLRDGKPTCPAVAAAFDLMDRVANAQGVDLVVASGYRSDAEQAVLFARHPDPKWVARPGTSRHRDATELDIDGTGAAAWLHANAGRFGFVQRYSWEPWHYGYLPGCGDAAEAVGVIAESLGAVTPGTQASLPEWVPGAYRDIVVRAALANGVPPVVLAALLQAESGFNPRAVSPVGAQGIAQFMPGTAAGQGLRDPFDPAQAIPAAGRLLGALARRFGSIPLALAAYNAGEGAVERYGGIPPYAETQAYVQRIMALAGGGGALVGSAGGSAVRLLPMT